MTRRTHGYGKTKKGPARPMPEPGTIVRCICGFSAIAPDIPAKCLVCRGRMSKGNKLGKDVIIVQGD